MLKDYDTLVLDKLLKQEEVIEKLKLQNSMLKKLINLDDEINILDSENSNHIISSANLQSHKEIHNYFNKKLI